VVDTRLVKNEDGSEVPVIEDLRIIPGRFDSPPAYPLENLQKNEHRIELSDPGRKSIFSLPFFYPRVITVPPRIEGDPFDGSPDVIYVEEPETTLVLPYLAHTSSVRIQSPGSSVQASVSIHKATMEVTLYNQSPVFTEAGQQDALHILIMASGYESWSMSSFFSTAQAVEDLLLSLEPFDAFSDSIEVHVFDNLAPLGCACGCDGIARLMCCNTSAVISAAAASGYGYDEIIVIHNTDEYCGGGGRDLGLFHVFSYTTMATLAGGPGRVGVAVHEFGHSFGNLCDEYLYPEGEFHIYLPCVNCRPTCDEFAGSTSQCQEGCGAKPSYYHPDSSIMLSSSNWAFNEVSIERSLIPRLSYFTNRPCGFCGNLNVSGTADGLQLTVSGLVYFLPYGFLFLLKRRYRNGIRPRENG
jgi:hypothetical protein